MQTKRVEWSYPTSPNADKFGFKDGCWVVEIVTNWMPKAICGFNTIEEAEASANKLSLPWDRISKRVVNVYPKGRW